MLEPSWRQQSRHYANRAPGAFPWGTWYYPMLGQALRSLAGKGDAPLQNILSQLEKEMQKPSPNRKRVADQAREASAELGRLVGDVERTHYERAALESLFTSHIL